MCQNLIKYQRMVPFKKNSLNSRWSIMDSLGKIPDQNVVALPWKNMTKIYHSYRNVAKRYSDFERGWESK